MSEIGFVLSHYGAVLLLGILAYQFGRGLTLRLKYRSALEEFSFSAALGLGVIAYIVMILGLMGLLYRPVLALVLVAGSVACYRVWGDSYRKLRMVFKRLRKTSKLRVVIWGAVIVTALVLAAPIFQLPLYPPTAFDGILYHLPSAKIYAQSHALVFTPNLRFAVFPQTTQMLFTLALIFFDDVLSQLVMLMALLILSCAMIAFGARFFTARAGWWGVAFVIAHPLVLWLSSVPYVDMLLMLYVLMTVYAFWNWAQERDEKWIVMAGIFCGLAFTVKYTAGLFFILFGLVAAYMGLRERRFRAPSYFCISAMAVAFPWLARNFYYTRNPVTPFFHRFFSELFGYGHASPEHYAGFFQDIQQYGIGKSIQSLVTLPWHLTFGQTPFLVEKPLAPYIIFTIPLLVIGSIRNGRIRRLMAITLGFVLFWFYTVQVTRYLMPVIPLLGLATAAAVDQILSWNSLVRRYTTNAITTGLILILLSLPGLHDASTTVRALGPPPITQEQRDTYLANHLPSYDAYKLLRELGRPNYTIYAVQDESMKYYADGVHLGDYVGPTRFSLIWDKLGDGHVLYETLRSLDVDYFLVNNKRLHGRLAQDEVFKRHFNLIYSKGKTLLFDLSDDPIRRVVGGQLLINPGFESLTGNSPTGWGRAGNPVFDRSSRESFSGSGAVRCIGAENVFYQPVSVQPGQTYTLSFTGRGIEQGQAARMQINWLDAQGQFITSDLQVVNMEAEWNRYEMTVTAPRGAASAVVYAACHDTGSAWLDDFAFATLRIERGSYSSQ